MNVSLKIFIGFTVLFLLYHAAAYMIMIENNIPGFFVFQFLFFLSAWLISKWQTGRGLSAWGLAFSPKLGKFLIGGASMGILLYGFSWWVNILSGTEFIQQVPAISNILIQTLPFAFGVIFSSLSEDILTRGYVYFHLHKKFSNLVIIGLSSVIYVFNHIYKLGNGPESWLYLFFLGILFIFPLVITQRLWFTAAMHWAGNTFFFITHQVIDTQSTSKGYLANYLFCLCILMFLPLTYLVIKKSKLASYKH